MKICILYEVCMAIAKHGIDLGTNNAMYNVTVMISVTKNIQNQRSFLA